MSLITYRDVRPWAGAIREKVTSRVMPPWHADRQYGSFRNDLSLTQREIDTIAAWAGGGASEGNPSDLPALPKFPEGWQIGSPDQVFQMQAEYQVPATGTIDYQYFEVPTNFTEDKWMQAGEVRAGDRAHVHHIIVYVREPKASSRPNVVRIRPILPAGEAPPPPPARVRQPDHHSQDGGHGDQCDQYVGERPMGASQRLDVAHGTGGRQLRGARPVLRGRREHPGAGRCKHPHARHAPRHPAVAMRCW